MGHYVLSVDALAGRSSRLGRRPKRAAPYFEWAYVGARAQIYPTAGCICHSLSMGCIDLNLPRLSRPAELVPWEMSETGASRVQKKILMKLHVNWRRASAQEPKRVLADSDGEENHLLNYVDKVLEHCEVPRIWRSPACNDCVEIYRPDVKHKIASGPLASG